MATMTITINNTTTITKLATTPIHYNISTVQWLHVIFFISGIEMIARILVGLVICNAHSMNFIYIKPSLIPLWI